MSFAKLVILNRGRHLTPGMLWIGLVCLLGVCSAPLGYAGDKLVITGQKTLIGPGQDKIAAEQLRMQVAPQFNDAPMPYARVPVQPNSRWKVKAEKTQDEKRKEMQRAERQNWALLAPGQLQDQEGDGYDFGVRDYDENADENIENRDYTFYGLDKSKTDSPDQGRRSRSSAVNQGRQADANRIRRVQREMSDQNEERRTKSHLNPFRVSTQSPTGEGVNTGPSRDLSGNDFLNPQRAAGSSAMNGSSSANGSLLGSSPGLNTMNSREDQRMESFRSLIGVNNQAGNNLGLSSSLINQSPDMTRRTLNPAIGSSSPSSFAGPNNNRIFNQRMNQQPAFGQPRVSGFSSLPSLDLRQPASKPNPLTEPSTSFDVTRRKF